MQDPKEITPGSKQTPPPPRPPASRTIKQGESWNPPTEAEIWANKMKAAQAEAEASRAHLEEAAKSSRNVHEEIIANNHDTISKLLLWLVVLVLLLFFALVGLASFYNIHSKQQKTIDLLMERSDLQYKRYNKLDSIYEEQSDLLRRAMDLLDDKYARP